MIITTSFDVKSRQNTLLLKASSPHSTQECLENKRDVLPDTAFVSSKSVPCHICGNEAKLLASKHLLYVTDVDESVRKKIPQQIFLYRCRACGVVFQNPLVSHEISRQWHASDNYQFNRGCGRNAQDEDDRVANRITEIVKRYCPAGTAVYDIGCGNGYLLGWLLKEGYNVSGCDVNAKALEKAKLRCANVSRSFFNASTKLTTQFAGICLIDVFEHFSEPVQILTALSKSLSPGGVVILEVPNANSIYSRILRSRWWFGLEHCFYFSHHSIKQLAKSAGLEVIESETDNIDFFTREGLLRLGCFGEDPVWGRVNEIKLSGWHRALLRIYNTKLLRVLNRFVNKVGTMCFLGDQLRIVLRRGQEIDSTNDVRPLHNDVALR